MTRRVAITGRGLLSCAGPNLEAARPRLVGGECSLTRIDDPHARQLKARYAGLIRDPAVRQRLEATGGCPFDRHVALALLAAREALRDAHLDPSQLGRRFALIFSTCSGPMLLIEDHYERLLAGQPSDSPEALEARRYHTGARVLAQQLGVQGPVTTVVTACSASSAAIALATDLIRSGVVDAALAGGADAFSVSTLAGFDGLRATSDARCAPFSKPLGLNLGEAAGFVVLEDMEFRDSRGAHCHGEVLGSGMSSDGLHPSAPDPSGRGLALAMQRALADAGLSAGQIAYINAHGTGTEANDKAETKAIRRVFSPPLVPPPISSTKSLIGHTLGAAGVAEIIATLLSAENGTLPTTANFTTPREGCTLDSVTRPDRPWRLPRVFLKNNLAFGGHNTSLILDAHPGAASISRPAPRASIGEVVITGCGWVTSLGVGSQPTLLQRLAADQSGLQPPPFPALSHLLAGFVPEPAVENLDRRLDLRDMDRSSRWATAATLLALRDAGFSERPSALAQLGIYLHLGTGPSWAENEYLTAYLGHDHQVTQLSTFPFIVPSSVTGNVSRALLLAGHNVTLSAGPGAGLAGLLHARAALRTGHTPALLSGAVDELTERILADRWHAGDWRAHRAPPPGEGAVVWLLETAEHARQRGAHPRAILLAAASATELAPPGAAAAPSQSLADLIQEAISQAGVRWADVDGLCLGGCKERITKTVRELAPGRCFARSDLAPATGQLEAAQSLLDLSAAWSTSAARVWLAVYSSPRGQHDAVLLKRVDPQPAPTP